MYDRKEMRKKIKEIVKHIWVNEIKNDYNRNLLIGEDTFKNAMYSHLKEYLKYEIELDDIRIYTEYYIKGAKSKADLVIGYLNPYTLKELEKTRKSYCTKEAVEPIAIFELKFKSYSGADNDIINDLKKVKDKYMISDDLPICDYYLAHISEYELDELFYVEKSRKQNHYIIKLAAVWNYKQQDMIWDSH